LKKHQKYFLRQMNQLSRAPYSSSFRNRIVSETIARRFDTDALALRRSIRR
jgi:hypothetical protein